MNNYTLYIINYKLKKVQIEIDNGSGFCFGVTTAIKKAEEELEKGSKLYCLGDIVHNGMEVERLHEAGLITIDHEQMEELHGVKVLLRAHGEPPETYALAERNNIEIIDVQGGTRVVKLGAQVTIRSRDGFEETYTIVSSVEADPLNGKLSNVTPLAVALMDRMVSDEEIEVEVEPREYIRIIDVK